MSRKTKGSEKDTLGFDSCVLEGKQNDCLGVIERSVITFIEGEAGTGKSFVALYYAVKEYLKSVNKKIIVLRTPVEAGKDKLGFLPSGLEEKLEPHFISTRETLEGFISKNKLECDLGKRIFFMTPSLILGRTFEDSIVVVDEAQQLEPLILKLILERTGKHSKVIVLGSNSQLYANDKSGRSALRDALKRFFDIEGEPKFPDINKFTFPVESVMRNDVVKSVAKAYEEVFKSV